MFKNTFSHAETQPTILGKVSMFCNLHPILCKSCVLLTTLYKIVFSAEHRFRGSQIAKTSLETLRKTPISPLPPKNEFLVFPCARWNPPIFVAFYDL